MAKYIEVKVPRPKPSTFRQYLMAIQLLIEDIKEENSKPLPRPIDNKIIKF